MLFRATGSYARLWGNHWTLSGPRTNGTPDDYLPLDTSLLQVTSAAAALEAPQTLAATTLGPAEATRKLPGRSPTIMRTAGAASNVINVTVALPSSPQAGNLLLAFISWSVIPPVMPSGWTRLIDQSSGGTGVDSMTVAYKYAGSGESASVTFATGTEAFNAAAIYEIADASGVPIVAGAGSGTASVQPSAVVVAPGSLALIGATGDSGSNISLSPSTGWTQDQLQVPTFHILATFSRTAVTTAGETINPTATVTGDSFYSSAVIVLVGYVPGGAVSAGAESTKPVAAIGSLDRLEVLQGVAATRSDPAEATTTLAVSIPEPTEALQALSATVSEPFESSLAVIMVTQTVLLALESLLAVASSSGSNIEAQKPLAATALDQVEATKSAQAVSVTPVELLQRLSSSATAAIDVLKAILASLSTSAESEKAITQTSGDQIESGQRVSAPTAGAIEFLSGLSRAATDIFEALFELAATRSAPVEAAQKLSAQAAASYEALRGVAAITSDPADALGAITATSTLNSEAGQKIAATAAVFLDTLKTVSASRADPVDAARAIAKTGQFSYDAQAAIAATVLLPSEAVARIANIAGEPFESSGVPGSVGVSQSALLIFDIGRGIRAIAVDPSEAIKQVSANARTSAESLRSVSASAQVEIEPNCGVTASVAAAYEALAKRAVARTMGVEAAKLLDIARQENAEWLSRVAQVVTVPSEELFGVRALVRPSLEALEALAVLRVLNAESVTPLSAVSQIAEVPLEWLLSVGTAVLLPIDSHISIYGFTAGYVIPADVASTLVLLADATSTIRIVPDAAAEASDERSKS